ncbi:MAG: sigma-70 family RNA polymerase sigma factor [Polyangiales bacterium]
MGEEEFDGLFQRICEEDTPSSDPRLAVLYERLRGLVRPIVRSRALPASIDEDDVLDTVFVSLLDRAVAARSDTGRESDIRSPTAYARAAIHNAINDLLRAHKRHERRRAQEEELALVADRTNIEEAREARESIEAALSLVLRHWKTPYSEAFYLRVVLEQSYESIAEIQQTSPNNVQQRVSRVLKFLRQQTEAGGVRP